MRERYDVRFSASRNRNQPDGFRPDYVTPDRQHEQDRTFCFAPISLKSSGCSRSSPLGYARRRRILSPTLLRSRSSMWNATTPRRRMLPMAVALTPVPTPWLSFSTKSAHSGRSAHLEGFSETNVAVTGPERLVRTRSRISPASFAGAASPPGAAPRRLRVTERHQRCSIACNELYEHRG
jgi:hypothetical protein